MKKKGLTYLAMMMRGGGSEAWKWEAEAGEVGGVESWQSDVIKLLFLFLFLFLFRLVPGIGSADSGTHSGASRGGFHVKKKKKKSLVATWVLGNLNTN